MKNKIDKKFYTIGYPEARNVGELKKLLSELPNNLRIDDERISLVVCNVKGSEPFLSFEEEGW